MVLFPTVRVTVGLQFDPPTVARVDMVNIGTERTIQGHELGTPSPETDSQNAQAILVGRCGEESVYSHLAELVGSDATGIALYHELGLSVNDASSESRWIVEWVNKDEETGAPYDIRCYCKPPTGKSIELFVEVKATIGDAKDSFEISVDELLWMKQHSAATIIARVYGVGSAGNVRVLFVSSPWAMLKQKAAKLYMLI